MGYQIGEPPSLHPHLAPALLWTTSCPLSDPLLPSWPTHTPYQAPTSIWPHPCPNQSLFLSDPPLVPHLAPPLPLVWLLLLCGPPLISCLTPPPWTPPSALPSGCPPGLWSSWDGAHSPPPKCSFMMFASISPHVGWSHLTCSHPCENNIFHIAWWSNPIFINKGLYESPKGSIPRVWLVKFPPLLVSWIFI